MSNFGKIKNIWNLDVVSREEMKTTLQEWDDALTKINMLINLKVLKKNQILSNVQSITISNHGLDVSKPIYVSFQRLRNATGQPNSKIGNYSFVVFLQNDGEWSFGSTNLYFNRGGTNNLEIADIAALGLKLDNNNIIIKAQCWNPNDKIGNITLYGSPNILSTLTDPIIEIKEEGEAWEISK